MPLFKGVASKSTPKKAIDYITRQDKAAFISVRNLFEDEDYAEQFADTMSRFRKGKKFDERKYYHFKLSCARKDNVSPEQAHLYAQELAAILFPDDECVIATHTDTKTVHSHIIVNAVNPITGKKLRITESDYTKMKDEANRLGSEFGYTKTDFRKRAQNKRTTQESHIILKGGTSWKEDLREVIEEAKRSSSTQEEFTEHLQKYGVTLTRNGKDFSYLHPEKKKPIRGAKLGENYTKSEVLKRFGEQNNRIKSTADSGRRSGFNGQHSRARAVRTGGFVHGGGTGKFIAESISGIEREMQRLNFAAECADRGTDAASEEREIERLLRRSENERVQRDSARQNEVSSGEYAERAERENTGVEGAVNADTSGSKYSYGKGD